MSMLNRPPHLSSPHGGGEGPFVHAASRVSLQSPAWGRNAAVRPLTKQSGRLAVRAAFPPPAKRGGGPRRGALPYAESTLS